MDTALEPQHAEQEKQKLYRLLVKLHRAYGKQKNKPSTDAERKEQYMGGYDAVKCTMRIFDNVNTVEDLKELVKIEAKRYKDIAEKQNSTAKDYQRNIGMYKAFKQMLAGILYINELDVDSHNVLRSEVIDFDYAS